MIALIVGVLIGTVGLAWMHHIVHKFKLFNMSTCWMHHRLHHGKEDPERELKRNSDIITYSTKRMLLYLNPKDWKYGDWIITALCMMFPSFAISVLVGLWITCNLEYLQHDYNNYPIDFTNRFDNWIGLNFGKHTEHHGHKEIKHEVSTSVWVGLASMYIWLFCCILLYPVMILNRAKSNNTGVYAYGLFQNIANYEAANGRSFKKLVYRMPSIFDKPKILVQYLRLMFGMTNKTEYPEMSHDISQIRNIYMYKKFDHDEVIFYKGKVIEGHHRYLAMKEGSY